MALLLTFILFLLFIDFVKKTTRGLPGSGLPQSTSGVAPAARLLPALGARVGPAGHS